MTVLQTESGVSLQAEDEDFILLEDDLDVTHRWARPLAALVTPKAQTRLVSPRPVSTIRVPRSRSNLK